MMSTLKASSSEDIGYAERTNRAGGLCAAVASWCIRHPEERCIPIHGHWVLLGSSFVSRAPNDTSDSIAVTMYGHVWLLCPGSEAFAARQPVGFNAVPIACTCKDWEYRGVRGATASRGCKHMHAIYKTIMALHDARA